MSLSALTLRNDVKRVLVRYDFFYKNGVPRWRGTGYYYSRFRPGLGVSVDLHDPQGYSYGDILVCRRILDSFDNWAALSDPATELQV